MELIIGGAYQGKLEFAKSKYGLDENDIYVCTEDADIKTERRCICNFEKYVLYCVKNGVNPIDDFGADSIIICNDISCGVVPVDPQMRAWRENTGRLLGALSQNADTVTRLFCGIPQQLK